jgi:hypothetical protein
MARRISTLTGIRPRLFSTVGLRCPAYRHSSRANRPRSRTRLFLEPSGVQVPTEKVSALNSNERTEQATRLRPRHRPIRTPKKSFTVVHWDQGGAGQSFNRKIPNSSIKTEQFSADLDDQVEAVCKRGGKNKVAIFGHS